MAKTTPIMALTGFLGSGKTTLLNHILRENQGLKIGVIVNDFGSINIDSLLVASQTDDRLELSNGCICCAVEQSGLKDAIDKLSSSGKIDYIIIEASGLAEPKELAFTLTASKYKSARLDSVIAVVDASNVLELNEKHPGFMSQLYVADVIILTKIDLINQTVLNEVEGYLKFINERARFLHAENGVIDTRLLLDADARPSNSEFEQLSLSETAGIHDHAHIHDSYQQVTFSTKKPLDPKKFEQFLAGGLPTEVYRAKGFVYFGMKGLEQKYILQLVANRHDLKIDDWEGAAPETNLVFIGAGLDQSALEKSLNNLIDEQPNDISDQTLVDITKYS